MESTALAFLSRNIHALKRSCELSFTDVSGIDPLVSYLGSQSIQAVRSRALAKLKEEGQDPPSAVSAQQMAWEWLATPERPRFQDRA